MHHNRAVMVLKTDGSSKLEASKDINCPGDVSAPLKNTVHDEVQNILNDSSSTVAVEPSSHCYHVQVDTGTLVRKFYNSGDSEDLNKLHKTSLVENRVEDQSSSRSPSASNADGIPNKNAKGDNNFRTAEASKKEVDLHTGCVDQNDLSSGQVAVSNLGTESDELVAHTSSGSADHLRDDRHVLGGSLGAPNNCDDCAAEDDHEKNLDCLSGLAESAEAEKSTLQSTREEEEDLYEFEEEDVKVCDICGDAGREDLLAICSGCIDGAEHTYCMRKKLRKVPEGDWLCEECKHSAELEVKKRNHSELAGCNERDKVHGRANAIYGGSKKKDCGDNNKIGLNRPVERLEIDPPSKRVALESTMVPASTQKRPGVLSRDNSFKSNDKLKAKLGNQSPTGSNSSGAVTETPRSPKTSILHRQKGSFGKSNSFGNTNTKQKTKLMDEVSQRHKPAIETKEGSGKLVAKSMSFKGNLSRSDTTDKKVKMLSPKFVHTSESRGQRQSKERNSLERKNSSKSDSTMANQGGASKHQSRSDNVSIAHINSSRDYKTSQSLRQSSHMDRTSDASGGDAKRSISASGNGMNSAAESPRDPKDCNLSSTHIGEVDSQSEKSLENSVGQGVSMSGISSRVDVASTKCPKEGINEEDKLKAAIEAAMQKRSDIYKRNKSSDKSNDLALSNTDVVPGNVSRDRLTKLNHSRSPVLMDGKHEAELPFLNFGSYSKQTSINNHKVQPTDSVSYPRGRDSDSMGNCNGELIARTGVIPEIDYIWRGGFKVQRGGKYSDLLRGFQAHKSTCASSKVVEMVKKFPESIVLNEVPRSSAWPIRFQGGGAGEENVGLYFFAKDIESYERDYRNLVESMMKEDLALKGTIDGLELLIFSSNQLSQKSQRWNTLFYLWGVFQGRRHIKASVPVEKPGFMDLNVVLKDKDLRASFSEASNCQSLNDLIEQTGASNNEYNIDPGRSVAAGSTQPASSNLSNGDGKGSLTDQACLTVDTKIGCYDRVARGAGFEAQSSSGVGCSSTSAVKFAHSCGAASEPVRGEKVGSLSGKDDSIDAVIGSDKMKVDNKVKHEESCMSAMADGGEVNVESDREVEDHMDVETGTIDLNGPNSTYKKRLHMDSLETGSQAASAIPCGRLSSDNCNDGSEKDGQESANKRLKITDESYSGHSSALGDLFAPQAHEVGVSSPKKDTASANGNDKPFQRDGKSSERFFFPVESHPAGSSQSTDSLPWKVAVSGKNDRLPDVSPSLELALGVKKRISEQASLPLFGGLVDKMEHDKRTDLETKKSDEDASASLSLSLAFPLCERERPSARAPGTSSESVLPERLDMNASFVLFEG